MAGLALILRLRISEPRSLRNAFATGSVEIAFAMILSHRSTLRRVVGKVAAICATSNRPLSIVFWFIVVFVDF